MRYRVYDGYTMTFQDLPTEEGVCMRSTDLYDAEGEEIWECDVLERGGVRGVVEWEEWARRFVIRTGVETRHLSDGGEYLVVGNAFEHRRLL